MPAWWGAVAQLGARLDGIEEVVGSNPIGSTKFLKPLTIFSQFEISKIFFCIFLNSRPH
jgi:hypothetical protein